MRKAYDDSNQIPALPEIKPVEEIVPEGIPSPKKPTFKHNEVFVDKKKSRMELIQEAEMSDITDDTNESIINTDDELEDQKNIEMVVEEKQKKGRGKRGKDKKKRAKRPPTEKQLAHLARIRELSRQKREAKKLEKERLKKENAKKASANVDKNRKVSRPKTNSTPTPTPPMAIPPPQTPPAPSYEQFFHLMDRYEEYKEKRNKVKQTKANTQTLPTGRVINKKYRPKPPTRPIQNVLKNEPVNPFDICFSYGR